MNHSRKFAALGLSAALAGLAVLTGCSGGTSSTAQTSGTSSSASASASQEEAQQTVMGKVTYVGSSYISVTVYTGGEDVTDFTTVDVSGLTESDETESINTTDDTEYLKVESGMLNTASREDVTTGAFIVSTCDEEGTQQIILLSSAEPASDNSASASASASGSAEEPSASDPAEQPDSSATSASGQGEESSAESVQAEENGEETTSE